MAKPLCKVEFNFDTITTEESLSSKMSVIGEKLKVIPSPWTGNKRKIASSIIMTFSKHNIPFDSILDLFCGSASMSAAFRMLNSKVYTNDLLLFPYFNAYSFLLDNSISSDELKSIFNDGDDDVRFIRDRYQDRFTPTEAEKIDRFISGSKKIKDASAKKILSSMSMLYHIMKHCYVGGRLNSGQVLAKLDHRLSHSRNDGKEMSFNLEWNGIDYDTSSPECHISNMDAEVYLQSIKPDVQTAYIDPPYGGDQSDYAKMYEFFEEYLSFVFDGLKKQEFMCDKFSSKKGYKQHFESLLDASRYIPNLVLSYNNSSWCPIEDIVSTIKKFRNSIIVEELDYDYKYRSVLKDNSKEYIIISKEGKNGH